MTAAVSQSRMYLQLCRSFQYIQNILEIRAAVKPFFARGQALLVVRNTCTMRQLPPTVVYR